jgi:hypothetical protein
MGAEDQCPINKEGTVKFFAATALAVLVFIVYGMTLATAQPKSICLKVIGEKVEVHNLGSTPLVIDREGIPDFAATSLMQSMATETESKAYNLLLTKLKRDARKAITSFDLKIDEKTYSYPKDSCEK